MAWNRGRPSHSTAWNRGRPPLVAVGAARGKVGRSRGAPSSLRRRRHRHVRGHALVRRRCSLRRVQVAVNVCCAHGKHILPVCGHELVLLGHPAASGFACRCLVDECRGLPALSCTPSRHLDGFWLLVGSTTAWVARGLRSSAGGHRACNIYINHGKPRWRPRRSKLVVLKRFPSKPCEVARRWRADHRSVCSW